MNKEKNQNPQDSRTRREMLKRVGVFVVPTMISFKLTDLAVAASGQKFSDWADKPSIE